MKHRGIVMSRKGMVSSAHSLISSTGVKILNKGGNAMDAAVAMANTSGVVLPDMCGLGGDVFLLYYDAKTQKISALNGSGAAPKKADISYFKNNGYDEIPMDGILSISLPGEVDSLYTALEKFGTMHFSDLCDDAIDLAENGCPISEKVARHLNTDYERIMRFPALKTRFTHEDGSLMEAGELYYNKEYANSLKMICKEGRNCFYKGHIADMIVAYSHKKGGLIEKEDLENVKCDILEPISVDYRNYKVFQTPPVSQGVIHLEEMNILNQFDLSKYGPNSAEAIHLMIEAKKIAFNDRVTYFGDPEFNENPIEKVLSKEYAAEKAKEISLYKTNSVIDNIIGFDENGHTTSFVVVDSEGNACSFIHSIANTWGSGEEIEGTGILMNNRASQFNLHPLHPNCIKPGKKTMHTLNTYMVTDKNGKLKWVGNTPGGDNQPQWNMQVLCNLIDFNMDVQSSLETPKWSDVQSTNPKGNLANYLKIESQIGPETIEKLESMGHTVKVIEPFTCSGASQVIEIRENNVLFGGSDPRADGCAMPE